MYIYIYVYMYICIYLFSICSTDVCAYTHEFVYISTFAHTYFMCMQRGMTALLLACSEGHEEAKMLVPPTLAAGSLNSAVLLVLAC